MNQEYCGLSFDIAKEPHEKFAGAFTVTISHLEPSEKVETRTEMRPMDVEVETGERDDNDLPILRKQRQMVERKIEVPVISTTPVEVGEFILWSDVSKRDFRTMISNWLTASSKVEKLLKSHNNGDQKKN